MRICIFLLALFLGWPVGAQELPPIQNYAPIDYNAENQNWGITQNNQKHLFFANNSGLLFFDGSLWRTYLSPNGSIIRSVKAVEDRIYTGCYMEFGYWKLNEDQDLSYHSLTQELEVPLIEDEQFWNIVTLGNWVLFQSLDRIYMYNTEDQSINFIASESTKARIFVVDETVYFQKSGVGIFTIDNGVSRLVSQDPIFLDNIIISVFKTPEGNLFLTEHGDFYQMREGQLTYWNIAASDQMHEINVYNSIRLRDGSFMIGTISNGIFHLSSTGELIKNINQRNGLLNNTVLSIYEDEDQNIWLGLDNGISVINNNSPFREYLDKNGDLGMVYTALLRGDYFYLGTNQGLFYRRRSSTDPFRLIPNTKGQVWLLKEVKGTLFCGHNRGTFVIEEGQAKLISNFPGTWDIKEIKENEDLLLQGNYEGLSILEFVNGQWIFRNKVTGFDSSSRFLEFIGPKELLVIHEYKGIFKLKVDDAFTNVLTVKQEDSKGYGASLVTYKEQVVYGSNNGVFIYDTNKDDFIRNEGLSNALFSVDDTVTGILTVDATKNGLWGFSAKNIILIASGKFSGEPEVIKIPVPEYFRRSMGTSGFEFIAGLTEDQFIIGITNGYVILDLTRLKKKEYKLFLTSIAVSELDATPTRISVVEEQSFKHNQNNLSFSSSVPEYDKYLEVFYQYKLQGYYEDWSSWSRESTVSFKNLPAGDYTFQLKARVGNTPVANPVIYDFTIARPWYSTNTAIVIYLILGGFSGLFIHRRYRKYYNKKHEQQLKEAKKILKRKKLKAQKEIAQVKNEKLKNEIDNKSRELAISTMSIIKKNEFLRSIKDKLKHSDSESSINAVIKAIDRNITNEDDWKFFEEAFNNADKNFLRKVKQAHSDLTPNDLRLCAYLRLNLSSKEIAPLLNISLRSVEVKRYRLRKKMNLAHENSLSDYLINL